MFNSKLVIEKSYLWEDEEWEKTILRSFSTTGMWGGRGCAQERVCCVCERGCVVCVRVSGCVVWERMYCVCDGVLFEWETACCVCEGVFEKVWLCFAQHCFATFGGSLWRWLMVALRARTGVTCTVQTTHSKSSQGGWPSDIDTTPFFFFLMPQAIWARILHRTRKLYRTPKATFYFAYFCTTPYTSQRLYVTVVFR